MIYYKLDNQYLAADELSIEDILSNDLIIMLAMEDIQKQIPELEFEKFKNYEDMVNSYSKFLLSNVEVLDIEFKSKRLDMLFDRVLNACNKYNFNKTDTLNYLQSKLTKMGIF